jgi:outer membrane protein assembly factor BamB
MRIDVGNVADSTVRVLTMPDADVELFKDNLAASSAPTTSNDNTEGYAVGSYWIDTTNDKAYVCLDASTGAAVWTETTQSGGGSSLPVDDTTSLVQDPSTNSKQMRIDVGNVADSTVRVLTMPDADVELVKNNLAASSAPTTGDDSDDGYAVSSVWIDTTNDKAYVCLDASVGAAVWNEIGEIPQILHQHFNTGDTGLNDIASAGYVEFDSAITIEITTTGGDVYATFTGLFVQTAGSGGFAKIALYDGSVIDSDNDADASAAEMEVGGASAMAQTLHATFTGLPAGTYYVRLYGKTASGTVRLNNTTTGCSMMAREY